MIFTVRTFNITTDERTRTPKQKRKRVNTINNNADAQRRWREKHREEEQERAKRYYKENKALVSEKKKVNWTCDICQCEMNYHSRHKHFKSERHLAMLLKI